MTPGPIDAGKAIGLGLALAGTMTILTTGLRLESLAPGRDEQADLLYLPSGKHLAVASLGYREVIADGIYLWAIQYYGHYEIGNRYIYLDKIFREVITELDPKYIDPYWIGALIMTVEAKDLDMALRLLDKGIAANPDEWVLPYLAGWECYHAKDYSRAASYFEKAVAVPGAPAIIRRSYAAMFQKQGDLAAALAAWKAIEGDPSIEEAGKEIARRHVHDLQVEMDLQTLRSAIRSYVARNGTPPPSLEALLAEGMLVVLPVDPEGNPYRYDRASGAVRPQVSFVLGEKSGG